MCVLRSGDTCTAARLLSILETAECHVTGQGLCRGLGNERHWTYYISCTCPCPSVIGVLADKLSRSYLQALHWSSSLIYEEMPIEIEIAIHLEIEEGDEEGLLLMVSS